MSEELKPCPFCGSEDAYLYREVGDWNFGLWTVKCCSCEALVDSVSVNEDDAVEKWNTRQDNNAVAVATLQGVQSGFADYRAWESFDACKEMICEMLEDVTEALKQIKGDSNE